MRDAACARAKVATIRDRRDARTPSPSEVFAACCVVWLACLPVAALVMGRGWRSVVAALISLLVAVLMTPMLTE
ncbi:MAG: hypothetical protein EXS15_04400 [Phycisphaerales bacterium]|nr:hypothetical protein [Phycisphaerales bacterium]